MLKANPLFGVGWGLFRDFTEENIVGHNSFAHCWGELGMFGYFFWLALVIASFKDSWAMGNAESDRGGPRALRTTSNSERRLSPRSLDSWPRPCS